MAAMVAAKSTSLGRKPGVSTLARSAASTFSLTRRTSRERSSRAKVESKIFMLPTPLAIRVPRFGGESGLCAMPGGSCPSGAKTPDSRKIRSLLRKVRRLMPSSRAAWVRFPCTRRSASKIAIRSSAANASGSPAGMPPVRTVAVLVRDNRVVVRERIPTRLALGGHVACRCADGGEAHGSQGSGNVAGGHHSAMAANQDAFENIRQLAHVTRKIVGERDWRAPRVPGRARAGRGERDIRRRGGRQRRDVLTTLAQGRQEEWGRPKGGSKGRREIRRAPPWSRGRDSTSR